MADLSCTNCASRIDSIFCSLPQTDVADLSIHKVTNHYRRGQTIFYEGTPCVGLFCIFSGKVKIFKNGTDGRETILRIAGHSDVLGYQALLTDEGYCATAEVIEDATLCFVDRTYFKQLLAHSPDLALKVIQRLGNEVCHASEHVADILNKPVRQRLCKLLLTLGATYGRQDKQGTFLNIRLSRAEIASLVGATPETVIRLLSDFHDAGYLALQGRDIYLTNRQSLLDEAGVDI